MGLLLFFISSIQRRMNKIEKENKELRCIFLSVRIESSSLESVDKLHKFARVKNDPFIFLLLALPEQTKESQLVT